MSVGLTSVYVVAFGRGVTIVANGSRGEVELRCEPVGRYLHVPNSEPCGRCEHREHCKDIVGCPMAEAWHRVRSDYAAATRRRE